MSKNLPEKSLGDHRILNTFCMWKLFLCRGTMKNYFSIILFSFLFFRVPFVLLLPSHIPRDSESNTHLHICLDSWLFVIINAMQLIPLISSLFSSLHARISSQQVPESSANFSLQYSHVSPNVFCVDCWTIKAQVRKMRACETTTRKTWFWKGGSLGLILPNSKFLPSWPPAYWVSASGRKWASLHGIISQSFLALTRW